MRKQKYYFGSGRTPGFTLIELLIIVAIIGVLTSIIAINFDRAQARSRDTRRISDLNAIAKAFQLYRISKNTYVLTGYGASGPTYLGDGWFNGTSSNGAGSGYYNKSVNDGLVDNGYLNGTIVDPTGGKICGTSLSEKYCYVFYCDHVNNNKATIYARLEFPSPEQTATTTQGFLHNSNDLAATGMNYAVTMIP